MWMHLFCQLLVRMMTGQVESIFSSEEMILTDEHIASLPKHAKVYTGMAKSYLKKLRSDSWNRTCGAY